MSSEKTFRKLVNKAMGRSPEYIDEQMDRALALNAQKPEKAKVKRALVNVNRSVSGSVFSQSEVNV